MPEAQTEQAPQSLTPDAATAQIEALLTPEDEREIEAPEGEGSPRTPVEEGPDEASPAVEETPDEAPDEPEAEADSDEPTFTVVIGDQEITIPYSALPKEITDNGLRQKDYTQKTQKLAQSQRALEQQLEHVLKEREIYSQVLPQFGEALTQLNPQEPNWEQLLAEGQAKGDVSEYWVQQARWNEYTRKTQAIREEQARVAQLQQLDTIEKLQTHLTGASSWLVEQMPHWKDEKRATADKQRIKDYARSLGYSDAEISQAYDPRMVLAMDKARRYDELMANKPRAMQDSRPTLKPGSAVGQHGNSKRARLDKLKQRVARTGRPDDAVAAIEAILG